MSNAIARKLESIKEKGALRSVDVANVLNARPESVDDWRDGKAFPRAEIEMQLVTLEFIVDQLSEFYSPAEAREWLYSAQPLLGGETPAELIQGGKAVKVLDVVNQLRDGVFV